MGKTKYFYKPQYAKMIVDFFAPPYYTIKDMTITKSDGTRIDKTEMEALPPIFLSDFARSIGVKRGYSQLFALWREKYPKFAESLKEAKNLEVERIRVNASMGLYNCSFSIFTLKNIAGWRDDYGMKHSGEIKTDIKYITNIINTNGKDHNERHLSAPLGDRSLGESGKV